MKFNDRLAVAIFFVNVTQLVQYMKLEIKVLEDDHKKNSLQNYSSLVQHEFKAPMATSITFLETLLPLDLP